MNMQRLETDASETLQHPIHLVSATDPIEAGALDASDRRQLDGFCTVQRREQWLRGRQALIELARRLEIDEPSSALRPPRRGLSLTHDDPLSIAAGIDTNAGIGVDLESWRPIKTPMLRWYLTDSECAQMRVQSNFTRLRLWTIKEALYKASISNQGYALTDFEIDDISEMNGSASCNGQRFRYTSLVLHRGILSIALDE